MPRPLPQLVAAALACSLAVPAAGDELHDQIAAKALAIHPELVEIRRDLHRHPEVSGREERTAARVAERLRQLGLEVQTGVGGHGVVAVLAGGGGAGPVVAYRADMDAVPAPPEPDDRPYKSTNPGVRHVCGHDVHTTVGLGVAQTLASVRERLPGTVKFLFQPAEENLQGAEEMLADGAFRAPVPEAIFAVHSSPSLVGTLGCPPGVGLPGLQPFTITARGFADAEAAAQRIVAEIDALSTVRVPTTAEESARITAAQRTPGGGWLASFVYAGARPSKPQAGEQLRIAGSFRVIPESSTRSTLMRLHGALDRLVVESAPAVAGTPPSWELTPGEPFPAMVNHTELTHAACDSVRRALGDDSVVMVYAFHPFNGEDFALYQQRVPGTMLWLGVANPDRGIGGVPHSPQFDADEDALRVGTQAMASVIADYLTKER
jgi:metal-dependent amidase/aminoacylase/carboxypeptidase family protein